MYLFTCFAVDKKLRVKLLKFYIVLLLLLLLFGKKFLREFYRKIILFIISINNLSVTMSCLSLLKKMKEVY